MRGGREARDKKVCEKDIWKKGNDIWKKGNGLIKKSF